MKLIFKLSVLFIAFSGFVVDGCAQERKAIVSPSLFDGFLVAGYVDNGAFVNLGGPAIKFTKKSLLVMLGMLPSIRIKKDGAVSAGKNTAITPTLGAGASVVYKHAVLQIPLYYNSKTAGADGSWNIGVGLGYRF